MSSKILPLSLPNIAENIYASFWRRLFAFFLDFAIFFPIHFIYIRLFRLDRLSFFYIVIPYLFIGFIYNIYFIKLWGATPGKRIMKVKIISKNGSKAKWKEAILRQIVQFSLYVVRLMAVAVVILKMSDTEFATTNLSDPKLVAMKIWPFWYNFLEWIETIWILSEFIILLFNKRKRALHDYIAGSVVIKKQFENIANDYSYNH